jgi:hypothetical protein
MGLAWERPATDLWTFSCSEMGHPGKSECPKCRGPIPSRDGIPTVIRETADRKRLPCRARALARARARRMLIEARTRRARGGLGLCLWRIFHSTHLRVVRARTSQLMLRTPDARARGGIRSRTRVRGGRVSSSLLRGRHPARGARRTRRARERRAIACPPEGVRA